MRCETIEIGSSVAHLYGSIKASLAEKGTPIPENNSFIGQ
jgi:predicted nucleic acid-binding protein